MTRQGAKKIHQGDRGGGDTDIILLKFQRKVKILNFVGKYGNFRSLSAARGGIVLQKGVHQVVFEPSLGVVVPPLSPPFVHVWSTAYDATHLKSSVSKQRPRGFSPAVVTDDSENCFLL